MPDLLSILTRMAATLEEIRRTGGHPDESMTTEEVAAFLRVHKGEVLRYVHAGLPHYRGMGKGLRFNRKDVMAFRERFRVMHATIKRSRAA